MVDLDFSHDVCVLFLWLGLLISQYWIWPHHLLYIPVYMLLEVCLWPCVIFIRKKTFQHYFIFMDQSDTGNKLFYFILALGWELNFLIWFSKIKPAVYMDFIFYKNIKKASLFTTFLLVNPFLSWIKNRKVSNCLSVVFST
jgi:hypothetical protein